MSWKARLYIGIVVACGLGVLGWALASGWRSQDPARYACTLALALVASMLKVRLPSIHGTMSANFLFILIGLADFSLVETMVMGGAAGMLQSLWKPKRRPKAIQVLFNLSALAGSVAIAYGVVRGLTDQPQRPVFLALGAFLYFIANTGSVSLVLSLVEDKPVAPIWRDCHLWTFPYYLAGAAVAGFISATSQSVGWQPALLALPLMYLVYTYYRLYVTRSSVEWGTARP